MKDELINKKYITTCSSLSYLGLGECKCDDKLVYVPNFYPGDEGEIIISYKRNGQYFGKVLSLKKKSKDRIESKCPYFFGCGGCSFQDYSYNAEKEHKRNLIKNQLHKIGGIDVDVSETLGMDNPLNYRNKIQLHFGKDIHGSIVLGFYKNNSHEIFPIKSCMIEDPRGADIANKILSSVKKLDIPPYNEEEDSGQLKHLLIRTSFHKDQILCVLVTKNLNFTGKDRLITLIKRICPEINTLVQSVNGKKTNVVLGSKNVIVYGKGYIEDELCGLTYKISANSFFQVNPIMTEVLYSKAMELAKLDKDDIVLDAYSGIGTIGLTAAKDVKKVISVELVHEAVLDSIANAKRNKVTNFEEHEDDATKFIVNFAKNKGHVDVLFMDPPRKGSTPEFLEAVKQLSPKKIVYISCGPSTLARDLKELCDTYKVEIVQPVDLFPRTVHVETICLLSKLHEAKRHVNVTVDMDELDVTSAESKATYEKLNSM